MKALPNILTLARVLLTMAFLYSLSQRDFLSILSAMAFFLAASLTDFYDGYYAKKHSFETNFGKIMDPIADKFLLLGAFYMFYRFGFVPFLALVIIASREIVVTLARFVAVARGAVLAAEQAGKMKTVLQMTCVALILLSLFVSSLGFKENSFLGILRFSIDIFIIITVCLTLFSGISVLWNSRRSILKR